MPQTATNPKTGEKLQLNDITGQWERIQSGEGFSLGSMIENIPASASQFAEDITAPIHSPVQTAKGVGGLIGGIGQKVTREATEAVDPRLSLPKGSLEQYPEQMGQFLENRYGSLPAIQQTLQRDPVGSLADLSAVLTTGGGLLSKLPKLSKAGGAIQKVGATIEPATMMGGLTKTAIAAGTPKTLPADLYKSAAKFSTTLDRAKGIGTRTKLAETAIKHKLLPTEAGLNKLQSLQDSLSGRIDDLIKGATESGKTIPKSQIFKHLKQARKEVGGTRLEAAKDTKLVNEVARTFDKQLKKLDKNALTPDELQTLKTDAYKKIDFDIKNNKAEAATNIARKAIAKAAKEGIEGSAPEIKDLNKILGELMELKDPLTQSASRVENRDLLGIGTPLKVMAGQEIAGTKGAIAGFATGVLESKKAKLAIKLKEIQDAGLGNMIDPNIRATLIQQGLMQSGRAGDVLKEQE